MGFMPEYPGATQLKKRFYSHGKFDDLPTGITLHYTADGTLATAVSSLLNENLGYHIIIDRNGICHQGAKFTDKLYHAGKAIWQGKKPNSFHIAIALISWGKLLKKTAHYEAWTGAIIDDFVERRGGVWHKATNQQESSLLHLLDWLVQQGINPMEICGHDECATPPGRKVDPGGVLSFTPGELRKKFHVKHNVG